MEGTTQDQIQWLVRKNVAVPAGSSSQRPPSGVVVLGPYLTDQIRTMVQQGMLEADDELCPENSYWFSLHETTEVKRFLGVDQVVMGRSSSAADSEPTQPDLEATQPDLAHASRISDEKTPPGIIASAVEAVESSVTGNPEATGIITIKRPETPAARAQAQAAPAQAAAHPAAARKPSIPISSSADELASKFQRVRPPASLAYRNPEAVSDAQDAPVERQVLGMEKSQFLQLIFIIGVILAILGVIWVIRSIKLA